ncbi:hypothetical protein FRX31_018670, partial [Thalictrum thalictroides]
ISDEPVKTKQRLICSKCKKDGHNKWTCDARNDPSKMYKRKLNKYKRNEAVGQQTDGASTSGGIGRGGGGSHKRGHIGGMYWYWSK